MNRGVLQSSPVQQMMAGNPNNWWNINTPPPPPPPQPPQPSPPFFSTPSNFLTPYNPTSSLPLPSWLDNNQDLPESWSQLLMSGILVPEEEKGSMCQVESKKLENWEEQMLSQAPSASIKQESSVNSYVYGHGNEEFQAAKPTWSQIVPSSSPKSSVTSFSSSMLDFSNTDARPPPPDPSSECNSSAAGGAFKKARVQPTTTQSTFKVRKEKLGDRITALHQLVSPFGKTDTASVLLEAIGYIRFLQSQIEALSLPYLGSGSGNMRHQQSVQGEKNCIFPEDPGQLVNENCLKRKAASEQDSQEEPKKDLKSRGLCLVPVSCTLQVGSENGADYWSHAFGGGFR
ncbi:transcription factor bHLH68 isoform X2 [Cajanus cajan]|uniref:Transcription factor bHLH68 n=1 Tax=Cajanus cajan TaxID=3821 RepID=A0A151T3K8_CAJCA|nr:transcription factor bHLH68 isoform X2 [Cajanus cajan]KYP61634.1 Transcription factor bHLH68 [Cajanus cajan]